MIALDGARGLAAFSVLLFHVMGAEFEAFSHLYIAVDFFFVLSGFVLAPSLGQITNLQTARIFLRSRFLRIFPMVLAVMTFTILYDFFLIGKHAILGESQSKPIILSIPTLAFSFLMLQIFYKPAVLVNYPVWSLSAEWIANILTASLNGFFRKKNYLAVTLGGLMIMYSALTDSELFNQLGRAIWGFSIGMIAFKLREIHRRYWLFTKIITALLLPIYFIVPSLGALQSLISVWPFVAGILILSRQKPSLHAAKICTFVGRYSYGFYLWHFPMLSIVGFMVRDLKANNASLFVLLLEIVMTSLLSTFTTNISLKLFEEPIRMKWK